MTVAFSCIVYVKSQFGLQMGSTTAFGLEIRVPMEFLVSLYNWDGRLCEFKGCKEPLSDIYQYTHPFSIGQMKESPKV